MLCIFAYSLSVDCLVGVKMVRLAALQNSVKVYSYNQMFQWQYGFLFSLVVQGAHTMVRSIILARRLTQRMAVTHGVVNDVMLYFQSCNLMHLYW